MIMHFSCKNSLFKVTILVLALCYSISDSSSILLVNAYISDGTKISSTGRAFEYESFPTYKPDLSAKGFGVPRAVPHNVPGDGKQTVTIGSEIKKPDNPESKDLSDEIISDDINNDGKQTREDQRQETQPMSLYSTIKLIRDKATEDYYTGHNKNLDEPRIVKGFGFGGGGFKLGR